MPTFYKSRYVNDTTDNGGVVSLTSYIQDSRKNNLLPDVSKAEVISGFERFRKFFFLADYNISILRAYLAYPSLGMDNVMIHAGTDTDTQAEADDYISWKGAGLLKTGVAVGALSSLVVTSENEGEGYNAGDLIRISDGTNEDFIRAASVAWDGYEATITPVAGTSIGSAYSSGAYVSAVLERGNGNVFAFWFKETIPMDIASYLNNLSRIEFLHRSL